MRSSGYCNECQHWLEFKDEEAKGVGMCRKITSLRGNKLAYLEGTQPVFRTQGIFGCILFESKEE